MSAIGDSGLDSVRRARLERSIAAEPGLERELELIADALPSPVRRRFWEALARVSSTHRSIASAVLEALSEAAGGRR